MKRILDCTASDFGKMNGQELKQAIRAGEGRTMLSENMATVPPLYPNVTNSELAASFGADLLLLNIFDVFDPKISGLEAGEKSVEKVKHLTGRPVGVNLEPVDLDAEKLADFDMLETGRQATEASLKEAEKLGFDFICLTGNPKTGVTNREILGAIKKTREILGENGMIIAGKMHGAGVAGETGGDIITEEDISKFIEAGADVILMPAPGTVPGITLEKTGEYVRHAHSKGALVMLTIGTSQEGSDEQTIREIALGAKMAGADIHHIGDAGFYGIAVPENIFTYSIAIRGRRHTFSRMAVSINR
ncbi:PEP phosphonomutase [Salinicoccus sediminis]|uniref:PEP phosphonomutase n=1 Tax=Salinicoccus sediminis TaxID=1432562 RepID=A0A0M2SLV4_9STAP|nr:hypothetical protein [Salinicoccus sediminis]KKK33827.1 PEP phosphonomutase [Salinicoccus sediminis]